MTVRRIVTGGAAALAAWGVLGMVPAAAQAGPASVLTWTQQAPATSPGARFGAVMAYDAATGNAVLFGGESRRGGVHGDTWTWDGSTWTQQHPAVHPPARDRAVMAYDAATGNVVLFGGLGSGGFLLGDTWTWDGSTWTKQAPAAHPSARDQASMAYDAATGNVVLFGGVQPLRNLGDTWTWDGSTWTSRSPPPTRLPGTRPRWPMTRPPARSCCSAAKVPAAPA